MPHFGERRLALSILRFQGPGTIGAGLVRFIHLAGEMVVEVRSQIPVGTRCTLRNLRVHASLAPGAGESFVYRIRINGADGNLTVTLGGADTDGADLVNEDVLVPGDLLTLQVTTSAAAAVAWHGASCECETVMR